VPVGSVTAVVDFGSSHTVTVLSVPGRAPRLVTVDGQPWLPSSAFLSRDDQLIVGADALRLAAAEPARLETSVPARIDEREVMLGDTVLSVTSIVKAVLNRAVRAAAALAGEPVRRLVLCYPAGWSDARLDVLEAAGQGLVPQVGFVAAPVAAAARFAGQADVPVGALLGVVDVGGASTDVAVVRRAAAGFEVVGGDELSDLGGAAFEERIVDHLKATVPGLGAHLTSVDLPGRATQDQLRALAAFRRDVRQAKELLSRHDEVEVALPAGLPDTRLTRDQLAELLAGDLDRIAAFALRTVVGCQIESTDLRAVVVVGGSARIPPLGELLGEVLRVPVQLDDQPEAAVALGAGDLVAEPAPAAAPPAAAAPAPARPSRRRRGAALALLVAVLLLAATVVTGVVSRDEPMRGAAGTADNRFTLPAPRPGGELTRQGAVGQGLVPAQLDVPVRVDDGVNDVDWTVHAVTDPATDLLTAAGAADPTASARWVLVETFLKARRAATAPYYARSTYLVDDRGLLLPPSTGQPLPATCPFETRPTLRAGEKLRQCYAFLVPVATPVSGVAISELGTAGGDPVGAVVRTEAAQNPLVAVSLAGVAPPGGVQLVRVDDTAVRFAVVDVVTEPSAYFDTAGTRRPGTRGVMVRAVAESDRDVDLARLAGSLALLDDRLARSAMVGHSAKHGCAPLTDAAGAGVLSHGRTTLCLLFDVPVGMPLAFAEVSGAGVVGGMWRLR
jgi:actin-like ATPase involved in cell morphogenesis